MSQIENNHKSSPKVSIGMPVYNGVKFIEGAIESLINQTFSDFELIISDNASTDGTEVICRKYVEIDKRIRYIRQPENKGALYNFKFVLDEANGEYFMWAAHDDRRSKFALERMIEVFSQDANVGLVFSDMVSIDLTNDSNLDAKRIYSSCGYISSTKKLNKYFFRLLNGCPSLIYGLHKRSILTQFEIANYDYMDIHLTHWYELNSSIKTIPLVLYIAGSDGIRNPYSLNGTKINHSIFLKKEWRLLRKHFGFVTCSIQFLLLAYFYFKNSAQLNKIRKN